MSVGVMDAGGLRRTAKELPKVVPTIALVVVSLLFIVLFNHLLKVVYKSSIAYSGLLAPLPLLVATAIASLFLRQRYSEFIPLVRVALRASSVGLLVYLIVEPPDFTLAAPMLETHARYIHIAYYLALVLAAISTVSPAFIVPVAIYIISTRQLVEGISGVRPG